MTDIITIIIITGVAVCYTVASLSSDTPWYSLPCKVPFYTQNRIDRSVVCREEIFSKGGKCIFNVTMNFGIWKGKRKILVSGFLCRVF